MDYNLQGIWTLSSQGCFQLKPFITRTETKLGEQLIWKITGEVRFSLKILKCLLLSGKYIGSGNF